MCRPINFSPPKRKPTDRTTAPNRHAEIVPTDECDKRRRVDRALSRGTRHPAPLFPHERPATIVERRKTPWRIVDPGPSPWVDPCPMTVAIRRPSRRDPARNPHVAVIGDGLPRSELVEVLVADNFRRDITSGDRPLVATLPRERPSFEPFRRIQRELFVIAKISAVETKHLARGDPIRGDFAVRFALA